MTAKRNDEANAENKLTAVAINPIDKDTLHAFAEFGNARVDPRCIVVPIRQWELRADIGWDVESVGPSFLDGLV